MKFPYYLFPKTRIEITSNKAIIAIEKSIYEQTILKQTDTRIDISERDDVNREYIFNIEREFILFRAQNGGTAKGTIEGVIHTHQKNDKSYSALHIKSKSWSILILTGFFWFALLSKIYGDISSNEFTSANSILGNIFSIGIYIGVRMFLMSRIHKQIAIVKNEVELSFK